MSSTLGPLCQLDDNMQFTSPPSLRRLSTSSCATNPNSPAPRTPKLEDPSSPTGFGKNSFGQDDFIHRFGHEEGKSHHGNSIAPNLLSINGSLHGYHSHEDLLQPDQIEHIDQAFIHQPQPQYTHGQHSIVRCQDSITPFIESSGSFGSWGPGTSPTAAAMTALQCATEGYEEEFEMSDEESQNSSPSPVLSYLQSSRRTKVASSPPETPVRCRRAPRRTETDLLPLVVSSADKPHECPTSGCKRRFRRQEHLRRHERTHTSDRPFPCDAEGCGKKFSRSDNLRAHRRTHMKQGGRNHFVPGLEV